MEQTPFWRASGGSVDQQYPSKGGVDKHVAAGTARFDHGEQQSTHFAISAAFMTLLCSFRNAPLMVLSFDTRYRSDSINRLADDPWGSGAADDSSKSTPMSRASLTLGYFGCRVTGAGAEPGVLWRLLLALPGSGRLHGCSARVGSCPQPGKPPLLSRRSCIPMSAKCLSCQLTNEACRQADVYPCSDLHQFAPLGRTAGPVCSLGRCSAHAGGCSEPDLVVMS